VAVVRVEQLYPLPVDEIASVTAGYRQAREVVWLQEEPANMGAWEYVRSVLEAALRGRVPLRYIGRPRSASPSEGSTAWHTLNQRALVEQAFDLHRTAESPTAVGAP
jgi:2-oxoglutarate dehydrogenase E1 component